VLSQRPRRLQQHVMTQAVHLLRNKRGQLKLIPRRHELSPVDMNDPSRHHVSDVTRRFTMCSVQTKLKFLHNKQHTAAQYCEIIDFALLCTLFSTPCCRITSNSSLVLPVREISLQDISMTTVVFSSSGICDTVYSQHSALESADRVRKRISQALLCSSSPDGMIYTKS
jgi:hypothetical protein